MSSPCEIRGIDTTGVGNEQAAQLPQFGLELKVLRADAGFGAWHSYYGNSPASDVQSLGRSKA
jgi:hypothetical protein